MSLNAVSVPLNDLPNSVEVTGTIWGKINEYDPSQLGLHFLGVDQGMEEYGFFRIGPMKVWVELNWAGTDPTQAQVAAIREHIKKIRGETEAQVNALQGQINRLLSITLDTKGR